MQNEIKDYTTFMTAPKAAMQLPLAGLCFSSWGGIRPLNQFTPEGGSAAQQGSLY